MRTEFTANKTNPQTGFYSLAAIRPRRDRLAGAEWAGALLGGEAEDKAADSGIKIARTLAAASIAAGWRF